MQRIPIDGLLEQVLGELESRGVRENAHVIDVIPAKYRYASPAEPVKNIDGVGDVYSERLVEAGVTDTHALADCSVDELRRVTDATESEVEHWVEQVPEADIYDDDDVWMNAMVIHGGGSIDDIISFIDSITGVSNPFDGDTVRFYLASNPPENIAMKTNPEALHRREIDVITTGIKKYFDMPISNTPYATVMQ